MTLALIIVALGAALVVYNSKYAKDRPFTSITKINNATPDDLNGKKAELKKVVVIKAGEGDVAFWVYDPKTNFSNEKAVLVYLKNFNYLSDGQQIMVKGVFKKTPKPEDINKIWKVSAGDAEAAGKHGIYLEAESFELVK